MVSSPVAPLRGQRARLGQHPPPIPPPYLVIGPGGGGRLRLLRPTPLVISTAVAPPKNGRTGPLSDMGLHPVFIFISKFSVQGWNYNTLT